MAKTLKANTEANDHEKQLSKLHSANSSTRALLLGPTVIPVEEEKPTLNSGNVELDSKFIQQINSARDERNHALHVAQIYRDLAETIQKEERKVKDDLERCVKSVRNFWRNQIMEGQSRAGQILRAALFRQ